MHKGAKREGSGVGVVVEEVLPLKQTAVSHGYIVSIAPCLDSSPSLLPPAALHSTDIAAESELKPFELSDLTATEVLPYKC